MNTFIRFFTGHERLAIYMTFAIIVAATLGISLEAFAHGVAAGDKGYIQESTGILPIPYIYLGAKHMMTGYDHLLFLFRL